MPPGQLFTDSMSGNISPWGIPTRLLLTAARVDDLATGHWSASDHLDRHVVDDDDMMWLHFWPESKETDQLAGQRDGHGDIV